MSQVLKLLSAAFAAAFFIASAQAQNAGSVTNHAFVIGKGAGTTGYTSLLCTSAQLAVGQAAADPICRTVTGDVTIDATGATAIGANKVTNSQLAQMAANSTKCNQAGGVAAANDCSAATMRNVLALVVGTNVQAWDIDLDCFAAIATTGQIKRTGSGTCSAGAVALADLATGTQDTVIGYFGSTTSSAVAISNCTGALTYSTATHTFGCNASAGTGTVTSVICGTGLSGGTITTTGTCALALNNASLNGWPADPAANATASALMMGLGVSTCRITPVYSTRLKITVTGSYSNTGVNNSTITLRYGTGAGPANAAAATGTAISQAAIYGEPNAGIRIPFTSAGIATGLTPGTAVWIDISVAAGSGTTTIQSVSCIATEF